MNRRTRRRGGGGREPCRPVGELGLLPRTVPRVGPARGICTRSTDPYKAPPQRAPAAEEMVLRAGNAGRDARRLVAPPAGPSCISGSLRPPPSLHQAPAWPTKKRSRKELRHRYRARGRPSRSRRGAVRGCAGAGPAPRGRHVPRTPGGDGAAGFPALVHTLGDLGEGRAGVPARSRASVTRSRMSSIPAAGLRVRIPRSWSWARRIFSRS